MRRVLPEIFLVFVLLAFSINVSGQSETKSKLILDMVHNNPGEPLTKTIFNDTYFLKKQGYIGQVLNDFTFAHAAITFDSFDKRIFPVGSKEREWVLNAAERVRANIKQAHKAGLKVYYFTDIIVLPKKLVELYHDEICDEKGKISFEKPKTIEIHRIMLKEVFDTFPDLDGLVIRVGETYLNNVPYHTGNNPITNGKESHIKLIKLLRDEVCVKRNKMLFYRTWSFEGLHDNAAYYLSVTDQIEPHPNLIFSIKHTKGDYHRLYDFNPTLGIGKHPQIVEVECQREYEGKGAFPNYIGDGVINGFEEYSGIKPQKGFKGLADIINTPQYKGVWTWSRGGGWVGPYINNEFWCRLNAFVISRWAQNSTKSEEQVFNQFMDENGIKDASRSAFRSLCLLSAKAVLRGRASAKVPFKGNWVWWTRDEFLSGIVPLDSVSIRKNSPNSALTEAFNTLFTNGMLKEVVDEKYEAVQIWKTIVQLSNTIVMDNKADQHYIRNSSQYGLLLHQIIAEGWNIMALGFTGDKNGVYDKLAIAKSIKQYDDYWKQYEQLKTNNADCATLYKPYAFGGKAPDYHTAIGMASSINRYRNILKSF